MLEGPGSHQGIINLREPSHELDVQASAELEFFSRQQADLAEKLRQQEQLLAMVQSDINQREGLLSSSDDG